MKGEAKSDKEGRGGGRRICLSGMQCNGKRKMKGEKKWKVRKRNTKRYGKEINKRMKKIDKNDRKKNMINGNYEYNK